MWVRQVAQPGQHVMYFDRASKQLLWLPARSYPGIPADRLNVAALYSEPLQQKLSWFYAQVRAARRLSRSWRS